MAIQSTFEIPDEIKVDIKKGWIAAIVSGCITLILVLVSINGEFDNDLSRIVDINSSVDVVLIFGFAFGIYKKSRVAATLMFVYFCLSKIYIIYLTGEANGFVVAMLFLYFYFKAMIATYKYHKLMKAGDTEPLDG